MDDRKKSPKLSNRQNKTLFGAIDPMHIPTDSDRSYQIFKREADNTTVCVEVVKGLHEARKRIEQARSASPETEHFIFDPLTQKTIDPAEPSIITDPLTP